MSPIPDAPPLLLIAIGMAAGVLSGMFGVGGGLVIVPALVYLAKFPQHQATGTSLAVLLLPAGIVGVLEYYRHGNVNVRAALIVAAALVIGAGVGAVVANRVSAAYLRLGFGLFIIITGIYMVHGAGRYLEWW